MSDDRHAEVSSQSSHNDKAIKDSDNEKYGFSELELKIIDDDNPPAFYDPFEVLETSKNLDRAAKAAVVIALLAFIPEVLQFSESINFLFSKMPFMTYFPIVTSFILTALGVALQIIFTYYPLKALAQILKTILEMEFNSRKAK